MLDTVKTLLSERCEPQKGKYITKLCVCVCLSEYECKSMVFNMYHGLFDILKKTLMSKQFLTI